MPIITFIEDILAATKGPYYRKVGRYTQSHCKRAVQHAKNELQKKLFFVGAICADELVASFMRVDDKRNVADFAARELRKNIKPKQVMAAMRIYLSAILALTSSQKHLILRGTGFNEQELLHAWCLVFQYQNTDMQLFDEVFLPALQQQGLSLLAQNAGKRIVEQLFVSEEELTSAELKNLTAIMVEDAAALVRPFAKSTEVV